MVSEEIGFNHVAEDAGFRVVETDLGEWIVQLRHERPSHMVMPAVHLSRQEIGTDMSTALGRDVSGEDIADQVGTARDEIRDAFFAAGMGITGANALIAESGTVMMVTNEGNGRLCASVPPVHVVLAGIEKLIPTFDDAVTQLRLLARSGTAQRITSYTTFITGPTPGHEMHIVLVDNGRRTMAAMPEFVEALHCIRCAACANVCPPYREVGGHAFGYIYTGAIGLVVTGFHHGLEAAAGPQSLCLSCNACETVCPAGIPLPRQILDVRSMVVDEFGIKEPKRTVLALYARPKTSDLALKIARRLQRPVVRDARLLRARRLPVLRGQTRWRSLPVLADRPLRSRVPHGKLLPAERPVVANGAAGCRVALFPGCMTDSLYPEQGQAIVRALRRARGARALPRRAPLLWASRPQLGRRPAREMDGPPDDSRVGTMRRRLYRLGKRQLRRDAEPGLPPSLPRRPGLARPGRVDRAKGDRLHVVRRFGRRSAGGEPCAREAACGRLPRFLPGPECARSQRGPATNPR